MARKDRAHGHPHGRTGDAVTVTSTGRPGFYFRVLEEGEVGAADPIALVEKGPQQMTVASINALLYSSNHPWDQLENLVGIEAAIPLRGGHRQVVDRVAVAQQLGLGAPPRPG